MCSHSFYINCLYYLGRNVPFSFICCLFHNVRLRGILLSKRFSGDVYWCSLKWVSLEKQGVVRMEYMILGITLIWYNDGEVLAFSFFFALTTNNNPGRSSCYRWWWIWRMWTKSTMREGKGSMDMEESWLTLSIFFHVGHVHPAVDNWRRMTARGRRKQNISASFISNQTSSEKYKIIYGSGSIAIPYK